MVKVINTNPRMILDMNKYEINKISREAIIKYQGTQQIIQRVINEGQN